ncbi:MAG TPA: aminotransferase class I/II-fold pyridoxal phosphate-dependent enzyme [Clostridiales bacterium]|nr:aminotransferase class I/II-fold pyridoxal phosphate-dependent enzyme [Clostridiales bacterium]
MKLYNKLLEYSKSNVYPMHMPGHKRNDKYLNMVNPYLLDITEIEGFDNLFHAKGIIKESMKRAATLYNSCNTNYLVGGSSAGILSGISACTNKGDKVLVARNSHKSVYNAIYLNELKPIYIYPQINSQYGINCGISPEDIEKMLIKHKDIKLIIITSPTYEGVISNVQGTSEISHKHKVPLFVDEAHGSHLGFHSYFPTNSIEGGADIVIHSLHKTLPAFTQTGLIHVNSTLVDYEKVKECLSIYQSSSPSYLLMASIDKCINLLIEEGEKLFTSFANNLKSFYEKAKQLKHLKILRKKDIYFDPSKIILSVRDADISSIEIYTILLEKYKIQVEMLSTDYIIAMTSICDTTIGFNRLLEALLDIDGQVKEKQSDYKINIDILSEDVETVKSIYEAKTSPSETIPFIDSEGRITREYIYLYPPGSPVLLPGERITKKHIKYLLECKKLGLSIQGLDDYDMNFIKVIM